LMLVVPWQSTCSECGGALGSGFAPPVQAEATAAHAIARNTDCRRTGRRIGLSGYRVLRASRASSPGSAHERNAGSWRGRRSCGQIGNDRWLGPYGVAPQFQVRHVAARGSVSPSAHMFDSHTLPTERFEGAEVSGKAPP